MKMMTNPSENRSQWSLPSQAEENSLLALQQENGDDTIVEQDIFNKGDNSIGPRSQCDIVINFRRSIRGTLQRSQSAPPRDLPCFDGNPVKLH